MTVNSFKELLQHRGHNIVCVVYGTPPVNVAIECETCYEVLFDFDKNKAD